MIHIKKADILNSHRTDGLWVIASEAQLRSNSSSFKGIVLNSNHSVLFVKHSSWAVIAFNIVGNCKLLLLIDER